jgi:hypothetical protein
MGSRIIEHIPARIPDAIEVERCPILFAGLTGNGILRYKNIVRKKG